MKILVVGSGGREHALAWRLAHEAEVICAPGNPGMALQWRCFDVKTLDHEGLVALAKSESVDLVVVGPEDPLVAGLGDILRESGIPVYGPSKAGAYLEASKAFSKDVMASAGIPTAAYGSFTDPDEAKNFARSRYSVGIQVAVKASGNALGKGVIVAETLEEALQAIDDMMVAKAFGDAGSTVVIEDRLIGREFSLLTIVGDHNFISLPVAQDYKRAFDGDQGPNTGGMGTYSPADWVSPELIAEAERVMVAPLIAELKSRGIPYRGTLFSGVMVVDGKPWCLEYNVRFGDPETQSVMARLGNGFAQALYQAATGETIEAPEILDNAVVTVVIAGPDYPASSSKGATIDFGSLPEAVQVFHAGTALSDGKLVTNGGRVCAVTAVASSFDEARINAYRAASAVHFDGARFRTDIGL